MESKTDLATKISLETIINQQNKEILSLKSQNESICRIIKSQANDSDCFQILPDFIINEYDEKYKERSNYVLIKFLLNMIEELRLIVNYNKNPRYIKCNDSVLDYNNEAESIIRYVEELEKENQGYKKIKAGDNCFMIENRLAEAYKQIENEQKKRKNSSIEAKRQIDLAIGYLKDSTNLSPERISCVFEVEKLKSKNKALKGMVNKYKAKILKYKEHIRNKSNEVHGKLDLPNINNVGKYNDENNISGNNYIQEETKCYSDSINQDFSFSEIYTKIPHQSIDSHVHNVSFQTQKSHNKDNESSNMLDDWEKWADDIRVLLKLPPESTQFELRDSINGMISLSSSTLIVHNEILKKQKSFLLSPLVNSIRKSKRFPICSIRPLIIAMIFSKKLLKKNVRIY